MDAGPTHCTDTTRNVLSTEQIVLCFVSGLEVVAGGALCKVGGGRSTLSLASPSRWAGVANLNRGLAVVGVARIVNLDQSGELLWMKLK